jgi:alanine dehydrogenase
MPVVGVASKTKDNENRVALIRGGVVELVHIDHQVVQGDAEARFPDGEYSSASATIVPTAGEMSPRQT